MLRRVLCLVCAALILAGAVPAVSEASASDYSCDFDLSFHLNADSFPVLLRSRAAGYASLVNRLGLRGRFSRSRATQSFNLEATLYYTDDPSLSYPFRLYGTKSRIFFTSPLINNEIILLNMAALMEFANKAKNTLGVPLTYVALLFPYSTESAFDGLVRSWKRVIGKVTESRVVTVGEFREISGYWSDEFMNNGLLHWWITGLAGGSDSPSAVEAELYNLPGYYEYVTGSQDVSVSVSPGSETWENASGHVLFSRQESDGTSSVLLSLPASENGYEPFFSYDYQEDGSTFSFDLSASVRRDPSAAPAGSFEDPEDYGDGDEYAYEDGSYAEEEYGESGGYEGDEEEDYGEEDDWSVSAEELPELMLDLRVKGSGLPRNLPEDTSFTLSVSVLGALYPDYSFNLAGETKKDGAVSLSLIKPSSGDSEPVEILCCAGTVLPAAEPEKVPDYMQYSLEGVYNVFSFNEQKLSAFNSKVLPPLVRSIFSFVAAAPTSACQSFLDDLTDTGILDMLVD